MITERADAANTSTNESEQVDESASDRAGMGERTRPVQRSEVLGPLNALADNTRLQIVELLALHKVMLAQEIIAHLDVGQSTVSRHLQQLVAAGFVTELRTAGANKLYRLQPARLPELFGTLSLLFSAANAAAIASDSRRELPSILHSLVDRDGLVTQWPRREKLREAVLDYLVNKFRRNHLYAEAEVNEMLNRWHTFADPANLRRQLVDYAYLGRTSSGDRYWRER